MSMKTFVSSSRIPVYSLSIFISNDMRSVDYNDPKRTNITFWIPNNSVSSDVENCLDFLFQYLNKIENTLDLSYSLSNLHIVLVPDLPSTFAGKGIIFIR